MPASPAGASRFPWLILLSSGSTSPSNLRRHAMSVIQRSSMDWFTSLFSSMIRCATSSRPAVGPKVTAIAWLHEQLSGLKISTAFSTLSDISSSPIYF